MRNINLIKKIIKRYKLDKPLPPETEKKLLIQKKQTLLLILKKKNKRTLFSTLAVSVYFWIKRTGLSLSLAKSGLLIIIITSFFIGTIGAGIVYFVFSENTTQVPGSTEKIIKPATKPVESTYKNTFQKEKIKKNTKKQIEYDVIFYPLKYENNIKPIGTAINDQLYLQFRKIIGNSKITHQAFFKSKQQVKKAIIGSIIKLGKQYRISIKIMNNKTSQIIHYETITAKDKDDIKRCCSQLVKKIVKKI